MQRSPIWTTFNVNRRFFPSLDRSDDIYMDSDGGDLSDRLFLKQASMKFGDRQTELQSLDWPGKNCPEVSFEQQLTTMADVFMDKPLIVNMMKRSDLPRLQTNVEPETINDSSPRLIAERSTDDAAPSFFPFVDRNDSNAVTSLLPSQRTAFRDITPAPASSSANANIGRVLTTLASVMNTSVSNENPAPVHADNDVSYPDFSSSRNEVQPAVDDPFTEPRAAYHERMKNYHTVVAEASLDYIQNPTTTNRDKIMPDLRSSGSSSSKTEFAKGPVIPGDDTLYPLLDPQRYSHFELARRIDKRDFLNEYGDTRVERHLPDVDSSYIKNRIEVGSQVAFVGCTEFEGPEGTPCVVELPPASQYFVARIFGDFWALCLKLEPGLEIAPTHKFGSFARTKKIKPPKHVKTGIPMMPVKNHPAIVVFAPLCAFTLATNLRAFQAQPRPERKLEAFEGGLIKASLRTSSAMFEADVQETQVVWLSQDIYLKYSSFCNRSQASIDALDCGIAGTENSETGLLKPGEVSTKNTTSKRIKTFLGRSKLRVLALRKNVQGPQEPLNLMPPDASLAPCGPHVIQNVYPQSDVLSTQDTNPTLSSYSEFSSAPSSPTTSEVNATIRSTRPVLKHSLNRTKKRRHRVDPLAPAIVKGKGKTDTMKLFFSHRRRFIRELAIKENMSPELEQALYDSTSRRRKVWYAFRSKRRSRPSIIPLSLLQSEQQKPKSEERPKTSKIMSRPKASKPLPIAPGAVSSSLGAMNCEQRQLMTALEALEAAAIDPVEPLEALETALEEVKEVTETDSGEPTNPFESRSPSTSSVRPELPHATETEAPTSRNNAGESSTSTPVQNSLRSLRGLRGPPSEASCNQSIQAPSGLNRRHSGNGTSAMHSSGYGIDKRVSSQLTLNWVAKGHGNGSSPNRNKSE